jgi:hypothetical protein
VIEIPGGLHDSTRRLRRLRVVSNGDWYLAGRGLLRKVGFGELAMADLEAVSGDLGERVFVAHPLVRPIEQFLTGPSRLNRRLTWYDRLSKPPQPTVAAVARGAQVAVLPREGIVWVDGERAFRAGENVPLPWTSPEVVLRVVRPRTVTRAMREVIGRGGPKHVQLPDDED